MYEHGGDIYNNVNCLDFSANINFLGMPAGIKEAVINSVQDCLHYPDVSMRKLKEAISRREQVDMVDIICGNGAAELIFALTAAIQPKEALIFAPSFYEYEQALSFYGAKLIIHELTENNNFSLTESEEKNVLNKITSETDMVFICNPNNPTGILTKKIFVERLLRKCQENNAILVVDECFLDFVSQKEKYSVADLVKKYSNLFVLKAFTKIFAIPGLRLGYGLCSNSNLLDKMKSGLQPWNVSVPAQAAGVAAAGLSHFEEQTREALAIEKEYLLKALNRFSEKIKVFGCSANYIFFRADESFGEKMKQMNILVRDCSNYRTLSKGYYRIAVRTHKENEMFVAALLEFITCDVDEKH